jgi:DNA processing protein
VSPGRSPRKLRRGASGWPDRLEQLDHVGDVPRSLWVWGDLPAPSAPCVAVVGSRRATHAGLAIASDIGAGLAVLGVTVISGMARGIDAAAHRGALAAGGTTVAVMGCGIEVCYPPEHAALRLEIVAHGCVLSEDGGEAPPDGWRFPRRNRLIAALAEAVVVVEATARSGALSTARWAADLGRDVFAVPGSIRSPTSVGTNLLIRDGAPPFLALGDLLEAAPQLARAMGGTRVPAAELAATPAGTHTSPDPGMTLESPLMTRLLGVIGPDPVHPDELAATLRVASSELAAALTTLQLSGAIVEVCGGRVARTL